MAHVRWQEASVSIVQLTLSHDACHVTGIVIVHCSACFVTWCMSCDRKHHCPLFNLLCHMTGSTIMNYVFIYAHWNCRCLISTSVHVIRMYSLSKSVFQACFDGIFSLMKGENGYIKCVTPFMNDVHMTQLCIICKSDLTIPYWEFIMTVNKVSILLFNFTILSTQCEVYNHFYSHC